MNPFAYNLSEADIKKEKSKARDLKKSEWWKRKKAKGICAYCGKKVAAQDLTMDHIAPISRGGKSVKGNVAAVCKDCNNKKKYKLPWE
ncbi:MAG: HNH endonuclease [Deltaproteobacteria bacterium]|nr:HNH endonuclease [Deltaproteobacteria bacterium]